MAARIALIVALLLFVKEPQLLNTVLTVAQQVFVSPAGTWLLAAVLAVAVMKAAPQMLRRLA